MVLKVVPRSTRRWSNLRPSFSGGQKPRYGFSSANRLNARQAYSACCCKSFSWRIPTTAENQDARHNRQPLSCSPPCFLAMRRTTFRQQTPYLTGSSLKFSRTSQPACTWASEQTLARLSQARSRRHENGSSRAPHSRSDRFNLNSADVRIEFDPAPGPWRCRRTSRAKLVSMAICR